MKCWRGIKLVMEFFICITIYRCLFEFVQNQFKNAVFRIRIRINFPDPGGKKAELVPVVSRQMCNFVVVVKFIEICFHPLSKMYRY